MDKTKLETPLQCQQLEESMEEDLLSEADIPSSPALLQLSEETLYVDTYSVPCTNASASLEFSSQPPEVTTSDAQTAWAHKSQQAQAVLEANSQDVHSAHPTAGSEATEEAPFPAETICPNKEEVLPQLEQFPSQDQFSTLSFRFNETSRFQHFPECNFLHDGPIPEIFSELIFDNSAANNCCSTFRPHPSILQNINFNEKNKTSASNNTSANNVTLQTVPANCPSTSHAAPGSNHSLVSKSYAQITAPKAVAGSIPTDGTTPDCGVLVERIKGSTFDDYAKALEIVAGKKSLVFIGQCPGNPQYVLAFVQKSDMVETIVMNGITIKGKWLCATHINRPATKLIVSDVWPFISDELIIKACNDFGSPVYDSLRRIPSSVRSKEYKHLLSFRRELLIVIDENKRVPDHIEVYSQNKFYKLGISTPGLTCYNCKDTGHIASACKLPRMEDGAQQFSHSYGLERTGELPPPTPAVINVNSSSPLNSLNVSHVNLGIKQKSQISRQVTGNPINKSFGIFPPIKDIPLNEDVTPLQYGQQKKEATESNQNWSIAAKNKKNAKSTTSKPNALGVLQPSKTPKFNNLPDIRSSKLFTLERNDTLLLKQPSEESMTDYSQSTYSSGRRKKKETNKLDQTESFSVMTTTLIPKSESNKPSIETSMGKKPPHLLVIDQLRLLFAEIKAKKPKHLQKRINDSQQIVEELVSSVWSLRTARRRAALASFQVKYPSILECIEFVLSLMPQSAYTTQSYKMLNNALQDIRTGSDSDGRKSRGLKS